MTSSVGLGGSARGRATLPPPEWLTRHPAGSPLVVVVAAPLVRRTGPRAEEAWRRARVEEARAANDPAATKMACAELARWLASRDRDLDEAVALADAALEMKSDFELRRELSAWLESLGESGRAAAVLKPIASQASADAPDAGYVLMRAGILKARSGAAEAAAASFEAALVVDPADPGPAEWLAALAAWQADSISLEVGVEARLESARRHARLDQAEMELEELWRAVAAAPGAEVPTRALAAALEKRGRAAAADEVWRAQARLRSHADPAGALAVHARRRASAMASRDPARGLGAAFDEGLDARLEGAGSRSFDAILVDLGMLDALAARLELRAETCVDAVDRAERFVELGQLLAGPLANEGRAARVFAQALELDPSCEGARAAVDERATRDARERSAQPRRGGLSSGPPHAEALSEAHAAAREWVRASVEGKASERAVALERLAGFESGPVRAVLLAAAAQDRLATGNAPAARHNAELATQTDSASPRAAAVLADVALAHAGEAWGLSALERAIAIVGPRFEWCAALAQQLDRSGEPELAVGWTQRALFLRPGERGLVGLLFERLARAGDGSRLRDALSWLLAQPQPASRVVDPFAQGLADLGRLDPERAVVVARRALDVLGPKSATLRAAMLEAAERASDTAFAVAILDRWLSCGAEGADRRELFGHIAELRERLGDDEGVARISARALREGFRSPGLAPRPSGSASEGSSDALLWRLRAAADRRAAEADVSQAIAAWRDLGAALWDLAEDRVGAVGVWERAARLAPGGYATMARDLAALAGPSFAFEYLARLVESEPDDALAAVIASDAARVALDLGEARTAFDLGARSLSRNPRWAEALEVAEAAAGQCGAGATLSRLYDRAGGGAFGRFGRRAIHYRGARFFERTGDPALALKHAGEAFFAVPSEGSILHFLTRAADRAGDRLQAMRALEQVAERETVARVRSGWLLRAASIAGEGGEGARRKVDAMLRALVAWPSAESASKLRAAIHELLRLEPEDRDGIELRFGRASHVVAAPLEGPQGARIAVALALASIDLFGDASGALTLLERALVCDADMDDFALLLEHAEALSAAPEAERRVADLLTAIDRPDANVGAPALNLVAAIARARGDAGVSARASIAAAVHAPDEDALVLAAEEAMAAAPSDQRDRFLARVSPARRVEVLTGAARACVAEGAYAEAAPLFQRAASLLEGEARMELEREWRVACRVADEGHEAEASALAAATADAQASVRADRWKEVADLREKRGDPVGAAQALAEACRADPGPLVRWEALARVAEAAGDEPLRISALEEARTRAEGTEHRVAVLRRLARAHERRGDGPAAERTWRELLAVDARDEEADHAIEALIVEENDYAELARHLALRADRLGSAPANAEVLRAVRLRRAAILEQRLGRTAEACEELARILGDWPEHAGALRYLADLLDQQARYEESAPLWLRAAAAAANPVERDELELRAARASSAAAGAAADVSQGPADRPSEPGASLVEALQIRVDAARACGADADLGDALDALAERQRDEDERLRLLLEAARCTLRAGDLSRALDRARRAAAVEPDRAVPRLVVREIEYRMRGSGAPDEARQAIEELTRIGEPLGVDDAALRAFLLAEALDVVQGGGAGMSEIEATRGLVGDHPLLSLALAERLAAQGLFVAAVDAYRAATAARGALLELRRPGSVALAGADMAVRAGCAEDAEYFVALAEEYEYSREAALAMKERAATLPPVAEGVGDVRLFSLEGAVEAARNPHDRALARVALARGRLELGDAHGAEPLLWEALADGLVEAGDVLAPLLASSPERSAELVRVRWQQAALEAGDIGRLDCLHAAALADGDRIHARAIEHVLRAFDPGAGPLPPPPLGAQPEQRGILPLLMQPSMDAAGEVFALLWEGAMQLFARDAASYGITGVERVVPGPSSALARLYEAALRVLDAPRIPLFAVRSPGASVTSHAALLSPASVILSGDVRQENAELRFELGRGICAALPPNALRSSLPLADGQAVLEALSTAFGPPELGRRVDPRTARLAESFWQIMPARAQRRLQELLRSAPLPGYEELVEAALQSGRRVGMFLAGDFAHAARTLLNESARVGAVASPARLRELCLGVPAFADLLRLAVRREYADARWHAVAPAAPRRSASSGRFGFF